MHLRKTKECGQIKVMETAKRMWLPVCSHVAGFLNVMGFCGSERTCSFSRGVSTAPKDTRSPDLLEMESARSIYMDVLTHSTFAISSVQTARELPSTSEGRDCGNNRPLFCVRLR